MHPKTKDTKLPSFLQRGKKHRVRKGITEALGVLGLGGESEEGGFSEKWALLDCFHHAAPPRAAR